MNALARQNDLYDALRAMRRTQRSVDHHLNREWDCFDTHPVTSLVAILTHVVSSLSEVDPDGVARLLMIEAQRVALGPPETAGTTHRLTRITREFAEEAQALLETATAPQRH